MTTTKKVQMAEVIQIDLRSLYGSIRLDITPGGGIPEGTILQSTLAMVSAMNLVVPIIFLDSR